MSFAFFALLGLSGLSVETTTPLALCPTTQAVETALSERLKLLETEHEHWTLVFENGHRAGPIPKDLLLVRLKDGAGNIRLEQELDVTGASCELRAESVALIVAEHFESARMGPPEPEARPAPDPQTTPDSQSEAPPTPGVSEPPAPDPEKFQTEARDGTPGEPSVGLGLGFGVADWVSPGVGLRLAINTGKSIEISLLGVAPAKKETTVRKGGSAEVRAIPLRFAVAVRFETARLRVWVGPELLTSYEWAESRNIARSQRNHRFVLGTGLQAGLRFKVSNRWAMFVMGTADYVIPFPGSRFEIDGQEVLDPGPFRWSTIFGLEVNIF